MARAVISSIALSAAVVQPVLGWTDTGHMLVAQIAANGLKRDGKQAVLDKFVAMTDNLYTKKTKALRGGDKKDPNYAKHAVDDLVGV